MSILTRYLLRAHAGPLLFAFTALTGLLFLNTIAQRLGDLVGKGLGWDVILEFVMLSLPHTIALTLPMSILVAVLYTFSDLTANSEITAMSAGGVRPGRILMPMVLVGTLFSLGMIYFNDQVLPEANHGLKNLMIDLANKSPTLELEEQVMNEIETEVDNARYYLRAARIDRQSNELFDVAIHDVSAGRSQRTTYADSGSMAFNAAGTDLYLTLYDGVVLEPNEDETGSFQRVRFKEQVVPLRGVGDVLERRTGGDQRGEREMTIAMLTETAREREARRRQLLQEVQTASREAVVEALGIEAAKEMTAEDAAAGETAEVETAGDEGAGDQGEASEVGEANEVGEGSDRRAAEVSAGTAQLGRSLPDDRLTRTTAADVRTKVTQAENLERSASALRVEIHKKFSIAFACLVFVLLGAPIAVRFPRGGVGMTIAVSVSIFAIYWMGLIGGETLADRGYVDPFISMWGTNLVFFSLGVWMSLRMGKWVATSRGGGWSDLLFTLKEMFKKPSALVGRS